MTAVMPQIEHVVLLMFENRSFDNLLGWLYDVDDRPARNIPDQEVPTYDGLVVDIQPARPRGGAYKQPLESGGRTRCYPIVKGTAGNGLSVPSMDPHEDYAHVNEQLFRGPPPNWNDRSKTPSPPAMEGFLQDYSADWESWDESLQILQTYTPDQVPVISGLARNFAVSDAWFSSVPTQTNPNRAFFHCGTSLGREKNQSVLATERFETDTLWNVLPRDVSWAVYYHDTWPLLIGKEGECYTRYTFPWIEKVAGSDSFRPIERFFADVENDKLPDLVFLEPRWGFGLDERVARRGNDYHPPLNLREGELFLKRVYKKLRANNTVWSKTLLVVTFDEHGGTWDHVGPPWGARPSGKEKASEAVSDRFAFDRFGVRVPTILVSPFIEAGTVFRSETDTPYDHTSVIRTVLKWKDVDPPPSSLGHRVANAPTFENVLTLPESEPRTDRVVLADPPADSRNPISIRNETDTKIYLYFGWRIGLGKAVIPHHMGYLGRGESYEYDTSKNALSWDYFVQASYWVGDGREQPGEKIDRGYTGLSDQWRLFWPDWELLLHHQTVALRSLPYKVEWTGDDRYGHGSAIRIVNDTYSKLYYHLYYKTGEYHGYLERGAPFAYETGKDHFSWDYSVNVSYWVGDSQQWAGEQIDGFLDRTWRFLWLAPKPIKHNQTLRIYQAGPKHPVADPPHPVVALDCDWHEDGTPRRSVCRTCGSTRSD